MYNYNPYMNMQQPYYQQRPQPIQIQGLQGKSVDSLEAVKAADISFDRNYKLLSVCR